MIRKSAPLNILSLLLSVAGFAKNSTQGNPPGINNSPDSSLVIHGLVLDGKNRTSLPYAKHLRNEQITGRHQQRAEPLCHRYFGT